MVGTKLRRIPRKLSLRLLAGAPAVLAVVLIAGSAQQSGGADGGSSPPAAMPLAAEGDKQRPAATATHKKPIRPNPLKARDDKPRVWDDRCEFGKSQTEIPRRCAYGDRKGKVNVVLTGDSLASAYFPAVNRVAKKKGWRLLALTKVGCPPYRTLTYNNQLKRRYPECLRWHGALLERIKRESPKLVIAMGFTLHSAWVDGKALEPTSKRNRKRLKRGYVKMLRTLRKRSGARLVVLKDTPKAPFDVGPCVAKHDRRPNRHCSFRVYRAHDRQSFERWVTRQVKSAKLVDLTPVFCPQRRCRAVFDRKLVLRDKNHPTATFARTLAVPLARRLPKP